jgi:predicted DNA repair protein MutK
MASSSLLALIDDIATLLDDVAAMSKVAARQGAAAADDVAAMTQLAAKKTAGVLGDDLALNAQQVTGVTANRELPVVWAVAKGSLVNKAILVPAALLISWVAPWAITPLLMLGGLFLCFEGCEKLAHAFLHVSDAAHQPQNTVVVDVPVDLVVYEAEKVKGAIRTDFILSAEIVVITLGTVVMAPVEQRVAVLVGISVLMTVGVYGLVAGIVKLDDLGLRLMSATGWAATAQRRIGAGLLWFAPWLMKGLSVVGTLAMFMVGGGILLHGWAGFHHLVESWGHMLLAVPGGDIWSGLLTAAIGALVGLVAGAMVLGVVTAYQKLRHRRGS